MENEFKRVNWVYLSRIAWKTIEWRLEVEFSYFFQGCRLLSDFGWASNLSRGCLNLSRCGDGCGVIGFFLFVHLLAKIGQGVDHGTNHGFLGTCTDGLLLDASLVRADHYGYRFGHFGTSCDDFRKIAGLFLTHVVQSLVGDFRLIGRVTAGLERVSTELGRPLAFGSVDIRRVGCLTTCTRASSQSSGLTIVLQEFLGILQNKKVYF